jgi:hypothetical protein
MPSVTISAASTPRFHAAFAYQRVSPHASRHPHRHISRRTSVPHHSKSSCADSATLQEHSSTRHERLLQLNHAARPESSAARSAHPLWSRFESSRGRRSSTHSPPHRPQPHLAEPPHHRLCLTHPHRLHHAPPWPHYSQSSSAPATLPALGTAAADRHSATNHSHRSDRPPPEPHSVQPTLVLQESVAQNISHPASRK